ncbi:MAG: macro domain-containing protein [Candidatus Zixiibacteriota bacterium]
MAVRIEVVLGDITATNTEAIVNAANNHLWMGSGVAGAIKKNGGEVIEQEAMAKGPVIPGEAVFTGAGRLPFKYVIHGAVMGQDLRTTDRLIRQTTIACLNIADKLGVESVAFPAFGTGVGGFPVTACANIMADAVRTWGDLAKHVRRVQFCIFDEVGFGMFKAAVDKRRGAK